jgi:hypothetical protein
MVIGNPMMWPWACQMVLKEQTLCQFPKLQWKKWVFYIHALGVKRVCKSLKMGLWQTYTN